MAHFLIFPKARKLTHAAGVLDEDHAVGYAFQVARDIAQGDKYQLSAILTAMCAGIPNPLLWFYLAQLEGDFVFPDPADVQAVSLSIRCKLDEGLGDALFERYHTQAESTGAADPIEYKTRYYRILVLVVIMMKRKQPLGGGMGVQALPGTTVFAHRLTRNLDTDGAAINADRAMLHRFTYITFFDIDRPFPFGYACQRQFQAAIENYQAPVERDLSQPSCWGCGKMDADLEDEVLFKCGGCTNAYNQASFCSARCEKECWFPHVVRCGNDLHNELSALVGYGNNGFETVFFQGNLV